MLHDPRSARSLKRADGTFYVLGRAGTDYVICRTESWELGTRGADVAATRELKEIGPVIAAGCTKNPMTAGS